MFGVSYFSAGQCTFLFIFIISHPPHKTNVKLSLCFYDTTQL